MKGTIYSLGLAGIDTPVAVECFFKHSQKEVKERLIELAKGYCNPGEKPKIFIDKLPNDTLMVVAETPTDFSYGLRVKKSVWEKSS